MLWVSLEEAEPIPDISWGIRVLQPPPEQENMEYGELGQGRGRLLQVPQHTASVAIFSASRLTLWGFLGLSPRGFLFLLWMVMGVAPRHLSACSGYQNLASLGQSMGVLGSMCHCVGCLRGVCSRDRPQTCSTCRGLAWGRPWAVALALLTAALSLQLALTLKQSFCSPVILQIRPRCPWWSCLTVGIWPNCPCPPTAPPTWLFHPLLPSAGGPHSSFVTAWMLFPAMLCKMGFAVLLGE